MANREKNMRDKKFAEIINARGREFKQQPGVKMPSGDSEKNQNYKNLTKADVTLQQVMEIFEKNENADLYLQNLLGNNFQRTDDFRWSNQRSEAEGKKPTLEVREKSDTFDHGSDDDQNEQTIGQENHEINSAIYEDALFSDQLLVLYLRLRYENKILRSSKKANLIDDYENLEIEAQHLKLLAENFSLLSDYAEEEIKLRVLALQKGISQSMKRQEKLIEETKEKYPWLEEELHARRNPKENQIDLFDAIDSEEVEGLEVGVETKEAAQAPSEVPAEIEETVQVDLEGPVETVGTEEMVKIGIKDEEDEAIKNQQVKKELDPKKITIDSRLTLRKQQKDPVPGRPMVNNVPLLMVDQTDYTDWHHYLYPQTSKVSNSPGSSHMLIKAIAGGNDNDGAAYILEVVENNKRILIDAGLRLHHGSDYFPDYASVPRPDLILISRANYRHMAALPYLSKLWPGVPVWTSPETAKILPYLLETLSDEGEFGEGAIYTKEDVKNVVFRGIPWEEAHYPFRDNLSITLHPAGYLPGAASFEIDSSENSIFITSDFALHEERIAPPADWPKKDYDVALLNITLGHYPKFNRFEMEEIMLDKIEEVLMRGGIALFPVNEIGRESSLLAMLRRGLKDGLISKVPLYTDGRIDKWLKMIEEINPPSVSKEPSLDAAYSLQWTYSPLTEENRYRVGDQPACLIVNSAMLKRNSPGFEYFKEILADPASAIFLPATNDGFVTVQNELEHHWRIIPARKAELLYYQWPGLAARQDILKALEYLNPRVALFVHGEPEAHRELRTIVPGNIVRRSLANSETIRIRPQSLND